MDQFFNVPCKNVKIYQFEKCGNVKKELNLSIINMYSSKENIIVARSFEFALKVIPFCELLEENKKFIVARQLLRSGTSIGANVREAQNAESKIDFIHKIKIAAKEANETEYWLQICKDSESYPEDPVLLSEIREIIKILAKIIVTSKS